MYLTSDEQKFSLFQLLLPISVVPPLMLDDEEFTIIAMYRAKFLFDRAVICG
jgi:hypothetical protein